jgi:hypothetical protein
VIGNATEYLLGTRFDVGTYATIFTGGTATYGDSDRETVAHESDSVFSFTDISLAGNFYNGMRANLNLVLKFGSSQVAGVITATLAEHYAGTIDSGNWYELGVVSNTPQTAINNGVIVSLTDHSTWTVTGPSYLTALSLDATSALRVPAGHTLVGDRRRLGRLRQARRQLFRGRRHHHRVSG